jgi:hypothetical protein
VYVESWLRKFKVLKPSGVLSQSFGELLLQGHFWRKTPLAWKKARGENWGIKKRLGFNRLLGSGAFLRGEVCEIPEVVAVQESVRGQVGMILGVPPLELIRRPEGPSGRLDPSPYRATCICVDYISRVNPFKCSESLWSCSMDLARYGS